MYSLDWPSPRRFADPTSYPGPSLTTVCWEGVDRACVKRLIVTTWTVKPLDGGLGVVGTQVSALSDGDVAAWPPDHCVVGFTIIDTGIAASRFWSRAMMGWVIICDRATPLDSLPRIILPRYLESHQD